MFCLVQDDDCHWYVIPTSKKKDWEAWLEESGWTRPHWADAVGGSPSLVEFTEYEIS